uniref:Uncharacterized protein n=1 Tax=Wuchereria bancrofti TaxID=6293 RepID=A0AAF5PJL4_WUCBA
MMMMMAKIGHTEQMDPLPNDEDEKPEVQVAPMEISDRETRTRPVGILVSATHEVLAAATPKEFHPADLGDLPEQLRRELQVPQAEPHTVVQEQGNNNIGNS